MGQPPECEADLRGVRLLPVGDKPGNMALLAGVLEAVGYTQLRAVGDARQVAGVVQQFRPDLILLDLLMPWLDGYEVLGQIRRDQAAGSFLPVMVLTADPSEKARQRALAAGATDFLIKPFDRTECL